MYFTEAGAAWRYAVFTGWNGRQGSKMYGKNDKRSGYDRREREQGPPEGWRDRRKTVERRVPEVREIPFSEWLAHLPARRLVEQD